MSQSDYINFKKTGIQLKNFSKLSLNNSKINSYSEYDSFTGYNIETTTPNNHVNYGKQTIPDNVIQVFGMKINNASIYCPKFQCVDRNMTS